MYNNIFLFFYISFDHAIIKELKKKENNICSFKIQWKSNR